MADRAGGRRILIVGQTLDNATILQTVLEWQGWRTRITEDAEAAFDLLKTERFDLLITAYPQPLRDGRSLIEHVRADPRTGDLLVIDYTADVFPENLREAFSAGADAVARMPVLPSEFVRKVARLFGETPRRVADDQRSE